ncbi:MAG: nucleotidyltransferase domain-containing protein [Silvanigrellales bacterium]|jgi:predicted nucleotidyltransferase|nr:nucleotidyltransferase domain-containing protein [Silvanigrellales bacterium]
MAFQALLAKRLERAFVESLVKLELARIVDNVHPTLVYLFGSAARGEMTDASDLDFLVVVPNDAPMKALKRRYYESPGERKIPVDVIFVTETDFDTRSRVGGICMVCVDEGRIVHRAQQGAA